MSQTLGGGGVFCLGIKIDIVFCILNLKVRLTFLPFFFFLFFSLRGVHEGWMGFFFGGLFFFFSPPRLSRFFFSLFKIVCGGGFFWLWFLGRKDNKFILGGERGVL